MNSCVDRFLVRVNYAWRLIATGISFVFFGLGGVVASLTLFSVLYLFPVNRQKRSIYAQYMVSLLFRSFIWFMNLCGLLTYEINGRELLKEKGQLVIANHPTLLDVVFLISLIPRANCIVKEQLWHNPLILGAVSAAGYIKNNSQQLMAQCDGSLKRQDSLIIFPGGTRDHGERPLVFLRGAANVALFSAHDITPVVIRCEPQTLGKGHAWYKIPKTPPHFVINILPDIAIQPFLVTGNRQSKMSRELTAYIEGFYEKNIEF
ncbi:FIG018329: 1-acyl-sn-glycerol-3-phosphate acyltransferase [hydrothermal vent metagenome]|uniref:FIG018329: 1-acyl-sn-glycerol-3-phosphate acyltransferase n=1 Tax=hydrothermal vent metagenome TaxID=652676 RepID=A0A3B1AA54_9ZZZZ